MCDIRKWSVGTKKTCVAVIVVLIVFCIGCYCNLSIIQSDKLNEKWTVFSGLLSLCAIIQVLAVYWLDNNEKDKDRKLSMDKEEDDRLLNKRFLILVNFMMHYLSIEKSLFAGILNDNDKRFTTPDILCSKFENVQISRDNVFAFLNIIYAIDDCVRKCIDIINTTGVYCPLADQISYKTSSNIDRDIVRTAAIMSGFDYAYYDKDKKDISEQFYVVKPTDNGGNKGFHWPLYSKDVRIDQTKPERRKKYFLISYDNEFPINEFPIYAIVHNFREQIEERLGITIDEIKDIDIECRKQVRFKEWEPEKICYYIETS